MKTNDKGRKLCARENGDGSKCENLAAAEMTFDGISYCIKHGKHIIKTQQEAKEALDRYREYQEMAFGTVIAPWPIERLRERRDEIVQIIADHPANDLHFARLDAEAAAITRELKRRRMVTTWPT